MTQAHALVHGEETDVFADACYQGVGKRDETQDIQVNWHVAMGPAKRKVLDKSTPMGAILDQLERANVELQFVGHRKYLLLRDRHVGPPLAGCML